MGHDILRCDFCGNDVMEGRNDWECSCGAICDYSTKFKWEKPKNKPINKSNNKEMKEIILDPCLIL